VNTSVKAVLAIVASAHRPPAIGHRLGIGCQCATQSGQRRLYYVPPPWFTAFGRPRLRVRYQAASAMTPAKGRSVRAEANGAARQRLAIREGPESMQNPATADSHGDFTCRVRIRHLDVLGYRIRTATWPADTEHTPLLMFNGMGARLELLDPLAQALAGIEIITFDVPGTGESPTPWLPYTLPMLATLTGAMLTKLGHEQVDVFGLSWGGMLAQQFAFQNPHRCRRLILAATMPGTPMAPARLSTLLKVATPRRFNDPAYARRIAGQVYGGAARRQPPPALHQQGGRTSWLGYLLQQLAVTGWSSHLLLPTLRQPTLILAGDDDPIVPLVNACWMACLIPRSRLHILHDGHHFFRSSTNETASAIRDFLDGPHSLHRS
jgi:poly(3-hydroxyoctanoate) depolymerase